MRPSRMFALAEEIQRLLDERWDEPQWFHARRAQYELGVARWTAVFAAMPQTAPCVAAREGV